MYTGQMLTQVINFLISIIEVFLGLRFVFKLFGANPQAAFVEWLYEMTEPLLAPFRGAFPSPIIEQGFVLEFSTLIAMFIYSLIGWLLIEFIAMVSAQGSARRLD